MVYQDRRRAGRSRFTDDQWLLLGGDRSTRDDAASLNGYSIIQAEDRSKALELIDDHPFLALGKQYSIEVFEVPRR